MDELKRLLATYSNFSEITVTKSVVTIKVTNFDGVVRILERHCFYVKQVRDNGVIDLSFDVHAIPTDYENGSGYIVVPMAMMPTFFRNLLNSTKGETHGA